MFFSNIFASTILHLTLLTCFTGSTTADGWYTYGGDYQHSGYVEYFKHTINNNTNLTLLYEIDLIIGGDMMTCVSIVNNILYYGEFNPNPYVSIALTTAFDITNREELWIIDLNWDSDAYYDLFSFATAPSISTNADYFVVLAGDQWTSTMSPILINLHNHKPYRLNFTLHYVLGDIATDTSTWTMIPPAVNDLFNSSNSALSDSDDQLQHFEFYFTTTTLHYGYDMLYTFEFNINNPSIDTCSTQTALKTDCPIKQVAHSNCSDPLNLNTISFQPAFYNNSVYYHIGSKIIQLSSYSEYKNQTVILSNTTLIGFEGNNLNSTIVISKKNNILFACGKEYLCAIDLSNNKYNRLWCNKLNNFSMGTTPAIDDAYVYLYTNGFIYGYDQFNGTLVRKYTNKNRFLNNLCYISSQPIVTQSNILWADGMNITIFDKKARQW